MSKPNWSSVAPLLFNVIGWVVVVFLVVRLSGEDDGTEAAIEAQSAKLEAFSEKLDEQLAMRDQQLSDQAAAREQKMRTDIEDAKQQMRVQIEEASKQKTPVRSAQPAARLSDANLKKLESDLANLRAHPQLTVDVNNLVQGLRPSISIDVVRIDAKKNGVVDLTLQARNLGSYAVALEGPELVIATQPVATTGAAEGALSPSQDYTFKSTRIGTLLPNQPINVAYSVALNDSKLLDQPLYYKLTYKTNTDPTVVVTASRLLQGKLSEKEVQDLSVSQHNQVGDLSVGRQKLAR